MGITETNADPTPTYDADPGAQDTDRLDATREEKPEPLTKALTYADRWAAIASRGLRGKTPVDAFLEDLPPRLPTGIDPLDEALRGGLSVGVTLLGAEQGMGKTALALQIAHNVAARGRRVLYFTAELSAIDAWARLASMESLIDEDSPIEGANRHTGPIPYSWAETMAEEARETIATCGSKGEAVESDSFINRLYQAWTETLDPETGQPNLAFIDDLRPVPGVGLLDQVDAITKDATPEDPTDGEPPLVVVDYLQMYAYPGGMEGAGETERTTITSNTLRSLARDLKLPMIVITAINREGLKYADTPMLNSTRGSQAIAYDASTAMFLYEATGKDGRVVTARFSEDPGAPDIEWTPVSLTLEKVRAGRKRGVKDGKVDHGDAIRLDAALACNLFTPEGDHPGEAYSDHPVH